MKINLSIIVPIYNAEKYLEKLLNSIEEQMNNYTELILINDGSSDNSLEICERHKKNNKNIIVCSIKNSGSGIARNKGIELARGDYLYFPDSDDILCENALENILNIIKENPDYVVFSYYETYRDDNQSKLVRIIDRKLSGDEIRSNYYKYLPKSEICVQGAPWNKLFKREIIEENNVYFSSLKRHQDEAFITNYIGYVNNVILSSKPIYTYYLNSSQDESLKFPKNYFNIRKELRAIFNKNIKTWKSNELALDYIEFSFILSLKRMFMLCYSPKWNMNHKEIDDYITNILDDKIVKESVIHVKQNKKRLFKILSNISIAKKVYYNLYLNLIYKKNRFAIKILAKNLFILKSKGNK